jgi:hypothetical protein
LRIADSVALYHIPLVSDDADTAYRLSGDVDIQCHRSDMAAEKDLEEDNSADFRTGRGEFDRWVK